MNNRLIVGLGNPGADYVLTRHNMGWMAIDHLAQRRGLGSPQTKFRGEFWRQGGLMLLKPLTFMNLSGASVREVYDFYNLAPEDVLIILDDMALPYGKLRLRAQGSAGGHNGLKSVLGALGTLTVPRLRVGLGNMPDAAKNGDDVHGAMIGYVLGHLNREEQAALPGILDRIEAAAEAWLSTDIQRAMTQVNERQEPPQ